MASNFDIAQLDYESLKERRRSNLVFCLAAGLVIVGFAAIYYYSEMKEYKDLSENLKSSNPPAPTEPAKTDS